MNFVEFAKKYKLSPEVELCESETKEYKGTSTPVQYTILAEPIKETGQNYMVLSKGLAEALNNEELQLSEAEATFDEDLQVWGLIRPTHHKVLKKIKLWE